MPPTDIRPGFHFAMRSAGNRLPDEPKEGAGASCAKLRAFKASAVGSEPSGGCVRSTTNDYDSQGRRAEASAPFTADTVTDLLSCGAFAQEAFGPLP